MGILDLRGETFSLPMPGLEPDNLLAFMALMGLLRALETAQPDWKPRAFWQGPPWVAHLELAEQADEADVANAANKGVLHIAEHFDVGGKKKVDFTRCEYRKYVKSILARNDALGLALAASLTAECNPGKSGSLPPSPLVIVKGGQLDQKFLLRLVQVPAGHGSNKEPTRRRRESNDSSKISDALFQPWGRNDKAEGFRWDPEDDQRYALCYKNPSDTGAALTVVGANRLAAIGFLSFPTISSGERLETTGVVYDRDRRNFNFVWPIWITPFSRRCAEALLSHPDVSRGRISQLRMLGIAEIYQAQRVTNGNYLSVTRAQPIVN